MNILKRFFKSRDKPKVENSFMGSAFWGGMSASISAISLGVSAPREYCIYKL